MAGYPTLDRLKSLNSALNSQVHDLKKMWSELILRKNDQEVAAEIHKLRSLSGMLNGDVGRLQQEFRAKPKAKTNGAVAHGISVSKAATSDLAMGDLQRHEGVGISERREHILRETARVKQELQIGSARPVVNLESRLSHSNRSPLKDPRLHLTTQPRGDERLTTPQGFTTSSPGDPLSPAREPRMEGRDLQNIKRPASPDDLDYGSTKKIKLEEMEDNTPAAGIAVGLTLSSISNILPADNHTGHL